MFTKISNSIAIAVLLIILSGCKARELGVSFADQQSASVDNTWVSAVKTCWPGVAHHGYTTEAIKQYLADPLHFRAAFAVYAPLNDDLLRAVVAAPVSQAPLPDISVLANSQSPILSRAQAVSGATNSNTTAPSPDSLCAIHTALPVGFR